MGPGFQGSGFQNSGFQTESCNEGFQVSGFQPSGFQNVCVSGPPSAHIAQTLPAFTQAVEVAVEVTEEERLVVLFPPRVRIDIAQELPHFTQRLRCELSDDDLVLELVRESVLV